MSVDAGPIVKCRHLASGDELQCYRSPFSSKTSWIPVDSRVRFALIIIQIFYTPPPKVFPSRALPVYLSADAEIQIYGEEDR